MGITSLTITLNMRTVNVILIMLITVVRVFWTNPDARDIGNVVRRISRSDETKKKKPAGKRRVNLTTANNYVRSL